MADIAPVEMTIDMTGGEPAEDEHLIGDAANDVVIIPAEDTVDTDPLPANAVLQADGSVILTLEYPVVFRWQTAGSSDVRKEERTTLHMHRLRGEDMRAIYAAGKGSAVPVGIARSCRMREGLFNRVFDAMDGVDSMAAAQVFDFFLQAGARKPSGRSSSP